MNVKTNKFKLKSNLICAIMVLFSMVTFAQNQQKIAEAWDLLLSNDRAQSREVFEKHLRKDIDKSMEILLKKEN